MSTIATPPAEQPELPFASAEIGPAAGAEAPASTVELAPLRLSSLGKRIEMLRVHRGLSKQALARSAGTSRQQLWRVMTGKSELTSSLRHRLADVLHVDSHALGTVLSSPSNTLTTSAHLAPVVASQTDPTAVDFANFVADP